MYTVFIAGSIKIKELDARVYSRIESILRDGSRIIVGDADGVDRAVQKLLAEKGYSNVVVYCSGEAPRNNIGSWPVRHIRTDARQGTREFYTAKDLAMADDCDYGLMVWDAKSVGTLRNVVELHLRDKKSLVYINDIHTFLPVTTISDIESLKEQMSSAAIANAEKTINLTLRIESASNKQYDLFDFTT